MVTSGQQGWYPDPGGAAERYRYWDGSTWSPHTTDDPSRPPPAGGAGDGAKHPPGGPRRSRAGLVVGLLALVVIVVVAATVLLGNLDRSVLNPVPTSTPRGGNDSPDPTPTGRPPISPQPSPTPSGGSAGPSMDCPPGRPNQRAPHPDDGRVYGGNLSFPVVATFEPATVEPRFSFAYDVVQQTRAVNTSPAWIAQLAVGRLESTAPFGGDARSVAEALVRCAVTGGIYNPYQPSRQDRRSERVVIDDRQGWLIDTEIRVDEPGLPFAGDHAIFLVVRAGPDWGFFFGAVPIGDAALDAVLAETLRGLRAD